MTAQELHAAAAANDFSDLTVAANGARQGTVVFSVRIPSEWNDEVLALMTARGFSNPNQLIKAIVREALDRTVEGKTEVTSPVDLLRYLDVVRRAIEHGIAA